ncbi:MAG: GIY-YIG nuclease family protein, partial [Okeania sp. SIO2G5]|nr:GIY-YIG nuclease family protein [Okeania sp. SIO2G5]
IQTAWIAENGDRPPGNGADKEQWTQPIDAKLKMTEQERALYAAASSEVEQAKVLKNIARRVEAEIKAVLEQQGVKEPVRFDPKLKEQGLLNIKPAK